MFSTMLVQQRFWNTPNQRRGILLFVFLLALQFISSSVPVYSDQLQQVGFEKVEDFEGVSIGDIDGQNSWVADSGVTVAADPEDGT
ncbi:MAG: hypothetical protein AAF629_21100, partial [Chloroflexota bacterium]